MSKWEAMWDRLCVSDETDLNDTEKRLRYVFFYQAEVLNGGHLQYFHNWSDEQPFDAFTRALDDLGCSENARLLEGALERLRIDQRRSPKNLREYSELALEGEFDWFDDKFYDLDETLNQRLEEVAARLQG